MSAVDDAREALKAFRSDVIEFLDALDRAVDGMDDEIETLKSDLDDSQEELGTAEANVCVNPSDH